MRKSLIAGLAVAASLAFATTASAEPTWAPASSATVHPGVMTYTEGAQCTSNFVFYDASNDVYIGQAAHCSGTGGSTETDGCLAASHPNGTAVEVNGRLAARHHGLQLVERDAGGRRERRRHLRLQRLRADQARPPPTTARSTRRCRRSAARPASARPRRTLDDVYSYGNSSLRQGITVLSPKRGKSLGAQGGGWTHLVYTVSPGIPGDSGSGFMDATGRAFGVLSTLQLAPVAASNGVSDLPKALAYMRAHGGPDVTLANGTEPFTGSIIG